MSTDILGLTDSAEVRAILGVSERDIAEQVFGEFNVSDELQLSLLDWRDDYATIITEGTEGTPTTEQTIKYLLLKKYAKYFCTYKMIVNGEMIAQSVGDGNNQFKRFAAKWEEIRARILAEMNAAKIKLNEVADGTVAATFNIMGKSTPDYDPVSNETTE